MNFQVCNLRTYFVFLIATMLYAMGDVAHAQSLDSELKTLVFGAFVSITILSVAAGTVRTVQRLNDPANAYTGPWWKEAVTNAVVSFCFGWTMYLGFATEMPAPDVVLLVAAAGYAPAWAIDKIKAFLGVSK